MEIQDGHVPMWVDDGFNNRDSITDSDPSAKGKDSRAEVPTQTTTAGIDTLVSTPDPTQTVQTSWAPGGPDYSKGRTPWSDRFAHAAKAAVYVQVSTPKEQDKQISTLRSSALQQGWEVTEFRERHARAGTRPVFNQMMRRDCTPKFHVLVVESLDSLARSIADLCDNLTWLHGLGIRVMVRGEGIDLDPGSRVGQIFVHVLNILAKAERSMRSRNVRAGVARAKSRGSGRPPRKFPRAQATKLRQEGLSIRAIADRLGVPTMTVADALRVAKTK